VAKFVECKVQFAAAATPASSATIGFDQAAKYLRIRDSWQLEIVSRSLQLGTSCLQLATRNSKLAVRNPPKKRTLIASAARLCRRFCDIDSDFAFSLQPTSSTCGSQSSVDSRQSPELVEFSSQLQFRSASPSFRELSFATDSVEQVLSPFSCARVFQLAILWPIGTLTL